MASGKHVIAPLRGVNLGGWLVLEPWITPSLFAQSDAVDEYTYCQQGEAAIKRLRAFRDTFVTEADFAWLATRGINTVRLPVGYWLFGTEAPYDQTASYVDNAFKWAKKHGLTILLDLHGAPGSQNGTVHSGRRGESGWHLNSEYIEATLAVLARIADRYGRNAALLGISVLNEPSRHIPLNVLEDFYQRAYALLRARCHKEVWIVCNDAFRARRWYKRLPAAAYPKLYMDHHHYQLFNWLDKYLPVRLQLWRAKYTIPAKIRRMARFHPLVVGEWSVALQHASKESVFAEAQMHAFAPAQAWFYWTYKTEYGGPWSFRTCVERRMIA